MPNLNIQHRNQYFNGGAEPYSTRSASRSPRKRALPCSSDTEEPDTPMRKRLRYFTSSPRAEGRRMSDRDGEGFEDSDDGEDDVDLERTLRACLDNTEEESGSVYDNDAIRMLADLPRDEALMCAMAKRVVESARTTVRRKNVDSWSTSPSKGPKRSPKSPRRPGKLLEVELYQKWLDELEYVLSAVEMALDSTPVPTLKRGNRTSTSSNRNISTPNLGQVSFLILYHILDEVINKVSEHHEGWGVPPQRNPSSPSRSLDIKHNLADPPTMTLMEESHDSTADRRTQRAVRGADSVLRRWDSVMARAVGRFKGECVRRQGKSRSRGRRIINQHMEDDDEVRNWLGALERAVGRGCCLLCEETGFGADGGDGEAVGGDWLMSATRGLMRSWAGEGLEEGEREVDELVDD